MKEFLSRGGGSEKQKEIVGVNKEEDYKERMMKKGLCERIWLPRRRKGVMKSLSSQEVTVHVTEVTPDAKQRNILINWTEKINWL